MRSVSQCEMLIPLHKGMFKKFDHKNCSKVLHLIGITMQETIKNFN